MTVKCRIGGNGGKSPFQLLYHMHEAHVAYLGASQVVTLQCLCLSDSEGFVRSGFFNPSDPVVGYFDHR